jgi:phosphoribosylglycinamide formyltransferase-1
MTIKLAVLFSGGGRTVLNILDHIDRGELDADVCLAVASRSGIAGIDLLAEQDLDVAVARESSDDPETGDDRVHAWLEETHPDLICLCGYLRLLKISPWMHERTLNIHPALLPKFGGKGMYGMRVHQTVIDQGESTSGCTVHYVDEEYDHGPTILQRTCDVDPADTPQSLANRIFDLECEAYPTAIKMVGAQLKV